MKSIVPSSALLRSIFPSLVASGTPCRHPFHIRQRLRGYSLSLPLSSPNNTSFRKWVHYPTVNSFGRSFHSSTAVSNCGNDNHICQLFRDIASRMERNADRVRTTNQLHHQTKSVASLTSEFCSAYLSIPEVRISSAKNHPKHEILELLLHDQYYVDRDVIASTMDKLHPNSLRDGDLQRIRKICTPMYESIFHYILESARNDIGVAFLVHLRRDIRDLVRFNKFVLEEKMRNVDETERLHNQLAKLNTMDRSIQSILTTLFRPGALNLRRITYEETPASIIEQVAFKEAVHPFTSLHDLRTRLGPGRRCFAFFHPALPNKPLAFIHVTLLNEMPRSMVDVKSASEDQEPHVAAFYSITNTEKGLAGVELGNHLIKSVVQAIQKEFPSVHTFCTLSPIPKFRHWLETNVGRYRKQLEHNSSQPLSEVGSLTQSELQLLDLLEKVKAPARSNTIDDGNGATVFEQLQPLLMKLAAHYLTIEKNHQHPLCSVAKFHTRNGAEVYRLNYMADLSHRGMKNSYGIMVNYRYVLNEIEENSVRNEVYGDMVVKDEVKCWLDGTHSSE